MSGSGAHRQVTMLTSIVLVLLGVAMVVRTIVAGGGVLSMGILLGLLFVAAGAGRLMLARGTRA